MTPYEIIEKLRVTPGLNDKRAILREHKDDTVFQMVLTQALDPRITYGIKKIPEYQIILDSGTGIRLTTIFDVLDKFAKREVTGGDATKLLKGTLELCDAETARLVEQIIAEDFKAGFGISLVNDEMKPFSIYESSYMGCLSYSEKRIEEMFRDNPFIYSEVKYDGRYLNVILKEDKIFFESRGGLTNPLGGALESEAKTFRETIGYDCVVTGELMIKGVPDRYKANGIIASFISIAKKDFEEINTEKEKVKFQKTLGVTFEEVKELITLVAWDVIPYADYKKKIYNEARSARLIKLEEIIKKSNSFKIAEYKIVNDRGEALSHYREMLARGEEGTVLKTPFGIWTDGKKKNQIKVKKFDNYDLVIVGGNYGSKGTKNEHLISSLNVESTDGLLKTSPAGLKEDDMKYITENLDSLIGTIVEVKSCGVSQDSKGNYSMLHPSFIKLRDDKMVGDDLQKCIEIEAGAKGLSNV